jgi:replicative DNA helicase
MFEYKELVKRKRKVGVYGIKYLDDKLKGILKGDLILIGARPGAGKSTIANIIAMANDDKFVSLFSLENFEGDEFLKECYYNYINIAQDFSRHIVDFISGSYTDLNEEHLKLAEERANKKYKHIELTSRKKDYGLKSLMIDMESQAKQGCQLIILDHLDYVDKDNANESDVSHLTALMKKIRDLQDDYNCAIIAISHLRKSVNPKNMPLIPSMDEFHGSSNKVKQATVVIMLAPDDLGNEERTASDVKQTWCCVRKHRYLGTDGTAGRLYFHTKKGDYENHYEVKKVNYQGTEVEDV